MAASLLGACTVLGHAALRAAALDVDAAALFTLVDARAPARLRERATAPNTAGTRELYLDGAAGVALMRWLASVDAPRARALTVLMEVAQATARTALLKLGYSLREAAAVTFATQSLLARLGTTSALPAQPPHVDAGFGSAQFLVALTPATRPTLIYAGAGACHARVAAGTTLAARTEAALRPLLVTRAALEAAMRPAVPAPATLAPGDLVALAGPVVHAGPATAAGEDRAVFFMTCSAGARALGGPVAPSYKRDAQTLPWIWADEREEFDAFVRSVRAWAATHAPHQHYWQTAAFCAAVKALEDAEGAAAVAAATARLEPLFRDMSLRG